MKRQLSFWFLLLCLLSAGCRRAATARQSEPVKQAAPTTASAQPQPTVCVAENMSRAALLQKAAKPSSPAQATPSFKR